MSVKGVKGTHGSYARSISCGRHILAKRLYGAMSPSEEIETPAIAEEEDEGGESKGSPYRERPIPSLLSTLRQKSRTPFPGKVSSIPLANNESTSRYTKSRSRVTKPMAMSVAHKEKVPRSENSPRSLLQESLTVSNRQSSKDETLAKSTLTRLKKAPRELGIKNSVSILQSVVNQNASYSRTRCLDVSAKKKSAADLRAGQDRREMRIAANVKNAMDSIYRKVKELLVSSECGLEVVETKVSSRSTIRKRRYLKESNKENSKSLHMGNVTYSGGKEEVVTKESPDKYGLPAQPPTANVLQLPYTTLANVLEPSTKSTLTTTKRNSREDLPLIDVERPKTITKSDAYRQGVAKIRRRYNQKRANMSKLDPQRLPRSEKSRLSDLTKTDQKTDHKNLNKTELKTFSKQIERTFEVPMESGDRKKNDPVSLMEIMYEEMKVGREEQVMLIPRLGYIGDPLVIPHFAVGQSRLFHMFEPELEIFASMLNK